MIITNPNGSKYKLVKFPNIFLLKESHKNDTISALSDLMIKGIKTYAIDVSDISDVRAGEIMVLSAQLEKSMSFGNSFYRRGAMPKNKRVRNLFVNSGKEGKVIHLSVKKISSTRYY